MTSSSKIVTVQQAADRAQKLKTEGKTIVTVNGVFDLLSVPHLLLLEAAKKEGDVLFVGVNSDISVRALKGDKRPIIPQEQRMQLLAGLACVDVIFPFDGPDPCEWLPIIRPDVHVNSAEYTNKCVEADTVKEIGARLVLVPRSTNLLSTSDVIDRIRERYS